MFDLIMVFKQTGNQLKLKSYYGKIFEKYNEIYTGISRYLIDNFWMNWFDSRNHRKYI